MNKLRLNGIEITDPSTIQRFQELVQEDRDIMEESTISLEEILEARNLLSSLEEEDFGYYD